MPPVSSSGKDWAPTFDRRSPAERLYILFPSAKRFFRKNACLNLTHFISKGRVPPRRSYFRRGNTCGASAPRSPECGAPAFEISRLRLGPFAWDRCSSFYFRYGSGLRDSQIHRQVGHDFAARLENAIEKINELGYDEIVVIGRDCPSLRQIDIENALAELESRKLVLGPDHRGGCYLIAFRLRDRALLRGVRWRQHTDCAQLCDRCLPSELALLPLKHELDSWADIRLFARCESPRPARRISPERGRCVGRRWHSFRRYRLAASSRSPPNTASGIRNLSSAPSARLKCSRRRPSVDVASP